MKVLILGNFGMFSGKLDGQTVKTRNVKNMFDELFVGELDFFDTESLKKSKFLFFLMLLKIMKCNQLIYLPAHGNLKYLFPLIYLKSLFFQFDIVFIVIGGWLVEFLKNKKIHRSLLRKIKILLVETELMKSRLKEECNLLNIEVFPNFRKETYTSMIPSDHEKPLKLVFMARIQKMKGLDYIFYLAEQIVTNSVEISIDFYGQIDSCDEKYFKCEIAKYPFIQYCGVLQPNDINITLAKYDVLLLPTHYYTEGFPGSILDAYMSGIPAIVTKWLHATEFVDHGETGFIIPFENSLEEFWQCVLALYNDDALLMKMKFNAINKSKKYSMEYAWSIISHHLN